MSEIKAYVPNVKGMSVPQFAAAMTQALFDAKRERFEAQAAREWAELVAAGEVSDD